MFNLRASEKQSDVARFSIIDIITARKRSLRQGYVFTRVCDTVHGGGGWSTKAGTPPGRYTTPRQVHLPAGTPPRRYTPRGRYTLPSRYTPSPAGTPRRQVHPPPGRYTSWQCMLGYGQQAGGTHPTGMHSCYTLYFSVGLVGVAVREYSEDHPSLDNAKPGIL